MCLGVPGRIDTIDDDRGVAMAVVDFGGVTKSVCLAYTPEAKVGDYAVVHAGFAITLVDEAAAAEALDLWRQMGVES